MKILDIQSRKINRQHIAIILSKNPKGTMKPRNKTLTNKIKTKTKKQKQKTQQTKQTKQKQNQKSATRTIIIIQIPDT